MPRELFGNVTRPSLSIGNRKWYTVPVSLLSHFAIVLALVLVPLLAPAWMPDPFQGRIAAAFIPLVPPTPPLPPNKPKPINYSDAPPDPGISIVAPTGINPEKPAPESGWEPSIPTGTIVGTFENTPPPPPVTTVAPPTLVRVGGGVRTPQKIHEVSPVYPPMAQAALEAVRQWQFTPTLLNGVPVPVIMTVTVNFTLR